MPGYGCIRLTCPSIPYINNGKTTCDFDATEVILGFFNRHGRSQQVMASNIKALPQETLSQFNRLDKALIDASSIIYAEKADFLELLASSVQLFSIPEILAETGPVTGRIKALACKEASSSNDEKLVSCALHYELPVISEDKKILAAMKRARRPFFNALMMLNFLLYHQKIQDPQYFQYHRALKKFARYSDDIWQYGAQIHTAINELI